MLIIQVVFLVLFVLAILRTGARYRAGDVTGIEAIWWGLFWVAAGLVVIFPDSTFVLARALGVGRGADAIVYAALVAIFFILFRLIVKQERMSRDITALTRQMALSKLDKELKNKL